MPELIIPNGASAGGNSSDAVKGAIGAAAEGKKAFHVSKYENYKCKCGSQLFTTAVVIKKVPAVELGEILAGDVPLPVEQIPVWVCTKCGELAPFIQEDEDCMKIIKKLLKEETSQEPEKS